MDQTCWVAPGAKRLTRELSRWDFKIHVWAYIGTDGVRCIRLVTGAVTGDTYLKLLRDTIGRRQWRKDKVWQQDNAPAHTAKIVKTFLNKSFTWITDWPPNSPDLSPIENLWGRMWRDALQNRPTTSATLWETVQTTFLAYDNSYVDNLIMSFRRRLVLCVENEGRTIGDHY
jgi:transposase